MENRFILTILLILILPTIFAELTGEITSQNIEIGIQITKPLPILLVNSPQNGTYIKNEIILNYTDINSNILLYNIDGNPNKTSISGIKLNLTNGQHTINFYAINEYGTIKKQINLTINTNRFYIYNENYKTGESTDFYNYPYESFLNMKNVILENEQYGKILFLENINLIEDSNNTDNKLNLDNNSQISQNKLYINTTALPNFNKKAKIWIYNLNFKNPRILKNKELCPENICKFISYRNNILNFEVEEFFEYEIVEGEIEKAIGGSSNPKKIREETKIPDFYLIEDQLILKTNPGKILEKEIEIKNNKNEKITITLNQKGLENILYMDQKKITLESKESKIINLEFLVRNNIEPDSYLGELKLISDETIEEIWIVLNVEDENSLFDIELELIDKNEKKQAGKSLFLLTKLYNLGETKKIDTILEYVIKNKEGKIVYQKISTVAVETHLDSIEEILLPKDLPEGEYIITLKTEYDGKVALATITFEIEKEEKIYLLISISLIISIMIILILKRKNKNYSKRKKSKSRGK